MSATPPSIVDLTTAHPKTAAGAVGSALTLVIVYFLNAIWGISPPAEVAIGMATIISTALSYAAPKLPSEG